MILVPAHSSWITEVPGTGRSSTTGRRARRAARHDRPPAAVGAAASMPSVQMKVRRAQFLQTDEVMRDDHDRQAGGAAQVREQAQQPALAGGIQAGQRLVEDQRLRRAGEQPGQHDPAHLAAARVGRCGGGPATGPGRPSPARQPPGLWSSGEKPAAEATSRSTRARISCSRAAWKAMRHLADVFVGRAAVDQAGAGGRDGQPGHDPGEGGLAGAVAAVDQHAVALVDGEADVAQCGLGPRGAAGVLVADTVELQDRRRRRRGGAGDRGRRRGGAVDHVGVVHRCR